MDKTKKVALPVMTRAASVEKSSINLEKRTAELIFTTEAPAQMGRWKGWDYEVFMEILSMDKKHVRLGRMKKGAPLLNSHQRFNGLHDQIGVVEKVRLEDTQGFATVRFSKREDVEPIWQDVIDEIVKNVSVGYRVYKYEELEPLEDGTPVLRATDWEPHEISLVTVPADPDAQIRKENLQNTNDCTLILRGDSMNKKNKADADKEPEGLDDKPADDAAEPKADDSTPKADDKPADPAPAAAEGEKKLELAVKAETTRVSTIHDVCKKTGVFSEAEEKQFITEKVSVEAVREAAINKLHEKDTMTKTQSMNVEQGPTQKEKIRDGMTEYLMYRSSPSKTKLTELGREFMGMSLYELCKESLKNQGVDVRGMNKYELTSKGLHSTSDFPGLLENIAGKKLRAAYAEYVATYDVFVRRTTVPNFKQVSRVQLGDGPTLLKKLEGAEIKRGTVGEGKEKYSLATYARIVGFTRELIINDDIDAFTRVPELMGRRVRELEADIAFLELTNNAALSDGNALFSSAHGNLAGSGTVISIASLGAARAAMRKQTGLDGAKINIEGVTLLVPVALETIAQQFVTQIIPNANGSVNPFAGKLKVVTDPRLDAASATAWYLVADTAAIDIVEMATLEGQDGPYTESRQGFEIEGIEWKVRHDVVAKAIDYRGIYKNPGA